MSFPSPGGIIEKARKLSFPLIFHLIHGGSLNVYWKVMKHTTSFLPFLPSSNIFSIYYVTAPTAKSKRLKIVLGLQMLRKAGERLVKP